MLRAYKLKIYANKEKLKKLDGLLLFWKEEVHRKIDIFWVFPKVTGSFPPLEYTHGSKYLSEATKRAWRLVKSAKKVKQKEKPDYKGNEIDLTECCFKFIEPETESFDFWIKCMTLNKGKRVAIPCKKTGILNRALEKGKLKKSCKIWKSPKGIYYLVVFIETLSKARENTKKLGIDTGMLHPVATSKGTFFGDDLRPLRIRTKHRTYTQISPYKQGLNRVAKQLVFSYPQTDFVLEDLKFKGKKKSSREFRRKNNNWAYKHLGHKLESVGELEGFKVLYRNPARTSITCPICFHVAKGNRNGECFLCLKCGYQNHADTVGAINILGRVPGDPCVPLKGSYV